MKPPKKKSSGRYKATPSCASLDSRCFSPERRLTALQDDEVKRRRNSAPAEGVLQAMGGRSESLTERDGVLL